MHRHKPFHPLILGLVFVMTLAACSDDPTPSPQRFSLEVTLEGEGSVTLTTGNGAVPEKVYRGSFERSLSAGTQVTLTADPADDFQFGAWGGNCEVETPICTFTLDATKRVSLSFQADTEPPPPPPPPAEDFALEVTRVGDGVVTSSPGGIDCGETCQASFAEATPVTLTATAAEGSSFTEWQGACAGETSTVCTLTTSSDLQVSAVFEAVTGGQTFTVSTGLARGSDDAEEYLEAGCHISPGDDRCVEKNEVELADPKGFADDIDFGRDKIFNADVLVGLRFTDLAIPQGAVITEANIQFQIDHEGSRPTSVTFQTQADADAPTFVEELGNISSRPTSAAAVDWQIEAWPEDEGRTDFPGALTPDLAVIVQEVVDRPEWARGDNALVFLFSGEGQRQATSFEDSNNLSGQNTQLTVTYQLP